MASALLIIDVQRTLCEGQWAAFDIGNVIARINSLSAKTRAAGMPVVLVQHEEAEGPMQHGLDGWQLDPRLATSVDDWRVRKTACDSFHDTDLHALLRARGVDQVIVCGMQSEFCVDSTVRGALARGYGVTLVSDGHTTLDNGVLTAAQIAAHHTATLANVTSYGPRVATVPAAEVF